MNESARFFAKHVGMTAAQVYDKWETLGLIERCINNNSHGCRITKLGESLGGGYSLRGGVPTFDYKKIKHLF